MPATKWLPGRCLWEMPPGTLEFGKEKEWWKLGAYSLLGGGQDIHFPTDDSGKTFGHFCEEQHRMGGTA